MRFCSMKYTGSPGGPLVGAERRDLVLVSDQISESGDIYPRDLRCPLARLGLQVLHGLPDHHELEEKRVVE
jgi:hypothetical protein